MAVFTLKKLSYGDAWIVNGLSADASGAETLLAAESGKTHYITSMVISFATNGVVSIEDGTTTILGPYNFKAAGGNTLAKEFKNHPHTTAGALLGATATAGAVCITIEGYTR